ncbi:MAG: hypothetical protein LBK74_02090 [Treponema sp.]|jgi:hypothetical protein|nr:hypothetical protein [Treponema sp.]
MKKFAGFFVLLALSSLLWSQNRPPESGLPPEALEVLIPSRNLPTIVPGSEELPRSFRQLRLGMTLDELKKALEEDGLFEFRGDRDVSFLPVKEENLVETTGLSFIRRAFFQLRDGQVFIMAFRLDPVTIDHYSVFTSFIKKYGEPGALSPAESVWENEETRISIERPLTVKYIDMTVFKAIMGEAKAEEAVEIFRRQGFLNEF